MALKIYNSLTNQKEEFKPLNAPDVKMYVCGPTVYDEPHIGHLRSAHVFQVIRNYLKYKKYNVTFVRNVTDIDDKIIDKARELKKADLNNAVKEVSEVYYKKYKDALYALMADIKDPPDQEPKATDHIQDMVLLIKGLIGKGYAYAINGDVYFEVDKFAEYGKLSHQKKEMMMDGVRIDPNERKKSPLDFALWKEAKEEEPSWQGPVEGKFGRPGWHIECSAMSMKHLGGTLDIHGGGRDLIFPHHENEIAQSEANTGGIFARYWLHHGLVTINGQKMSKSLKNYLTLSQIKNNYPYGEELLKLLFLNTHYRAPLDFSDDRMAMQESIFHKLRVFFDTVQQLNIQKIVNLVKNSELENIEANFMNAMDDDFNTPLAFSKLQEMMHYSWKSNDPTVMMAAAEKISRLGKHVFSLFTGWDISAFFNPDRGVRDNKDLKLDREVQPEIERRYEARKKKDFKLADEIRENLRVRYQLELVDWKDGRTTWRSL